MSLADTKNISNNKINTHLICWAKSAALVWIIFLLFIFFFFQKFTFNGSHRSCKQTASGANYTVISHCLRNALCKNGMESLSHLFNWHRRKVAAANDFLSLVGEKHHLKQVDELGAFPPPPHTWLKSNHQTERNGFRQAHHRKLNLEKKIKIKSHYGTLAS